MRPDVAAAIERIERAQGLAPQFKADLALLISEARHLNDMALKMESAIHRMSKQLEKAEA